MLDKNFHLFCINFNYIYFLKKMYAKLFSMLSGCWSVVVSDAYLLVFYLGASNNIMYYYSYNVIIYVLFLQNVFCSCATIL